MACFLVPTTEAIVTTIVEKSVKSKEEKEENSKESSLVSFSRKLKWLNNMLWGGAVLLAFEHVWHGEVVPYFPFLTAANNASDTEEMLHEMSTTGVTMAVLVTAIWLVMLVVSYFIEKRPVDDIQTESAK